MLINTTRFGQLEVDKEKIIDFPDGIPGLEHLHKYVLVSPEEIHPMSFLQSIEEPDIAFIIAIPFIFKSDYEPDIPDDLLEEMGIGSQEEIALFSFLVIPEDYTKATANLLAPIVINTKKLIAKQVILEEGSYPIRYPLFETDNGKEEDSKAIPLKQGGK